MLGHKFISLEDFRSKQVFFLCLFIKKKLEGKNFLIPTIEVVGYSSLKKNTRKNAKAIKERKINSKGKIVEVEEEICSSN